MKLKKFRAALQERPWLLKSIDKITGNRYRIGMSERDWEKHVEEWSVRNISEITVRAFKELKLDEKAEFIRHPLELPDKKIALPNSPVLLRRFEAFTETEFHLFTQIVYDGGNLSEPYAECWVAGATHFKSEGTEVFSIRKCIRDMRKPGDSDKTEHIFNAAVRILKVGIVGRCSSTIIDIFPFPADLDPMSV